MLFLLDVNDAGQKLKKECEKTSDCQSPLLHCNDHNKCDILSTHLCHEPADCLTGHCRDGHCVESSNPKGLFIRSEQAWRDAWARPVTPKPQILATFRDLSAKQRATKVSARQLRGGVFHARPMTSTTFAPENLGVTCQLQAAKASVCQRNPPCRHVTKTTSASPIDVSTATVAALTAMAIYAILRRTNAPPKGSSVKPYRTPSPTAIN